MHRFPVVLYCIPLVSLHLFSFLGLLRCHKVRLTLTDENASHGLLDLDALSGLTEVDIEQEGKSGFKHITKLGVSLRPYISQEVPAQMISMNPRYVVVNESKEVIYVRQCYLEVRFFTV